MCPPRTRTQYSRPMSSDNPTVVYRREGDVAIIVVDDGKANALSMSVLDALDAALNRAEQEAKAVVLAGRPGRFCAGFDLSVMNAGMDACRALVQRGGQTALRLFMYPKPVVIACTGHALAAGAVLLVSADHRVGAAGAFKIGFNEVAIGLPLPIFLTELADQRLSRRHLTSATMLAHAFDPESALDAGFLDEVVESEAVVGIAITRAQHFADTLNPRAFAASREPLRGSAALRIASTMSANVATFFVDR